MEEDDLKNLWSDSGRKTGKYIDAPKYDGPVATVNTYGAAPGYYSVGLNDPLQSCAAQGDAKRPCQVSSAAKPRLAPLEGVTFATCDDLYDALHAAGYLVITTHSGGTYWLVRGMVPPR